jgi:hypothetical protein
VIDSLKIKQGRNVWKEVLKNFSFVGRKFVKKIDENKEES